MTCSIEEFNAHYRLARTRDEALGLLSELEVGKETPLIQLLRTDYHEAQDNELTFRAVVIWTIGSIVTGTRLVELTGGHVNRLGGCHDNMSKVACFRREYTIALCKVLAGLRYNPAHGSV